MLQVVDVELTPNPHAIKFILNDNLLKFESRQFSNVEQAANDPLALGVFGIEGVVSVFYSGKFVTVEKSPDTDWGKIQRPFLTFITRFDASSIPAEKEPEALGEDAGEKLIKIMHLLNAKVMPALANDGGGLEVLSFDDNTLKVRYQGACGTCPSATRGTLMAIEGLLKREIDPTLNVIPE